MKHMLTEPMLQRRHFLAAFGALAASPSFAKLPHARQYAAAQALADRYVTEKKLAGVSLALATGGAPASYVNAGTLAFDSNARADENSLYRVYSMTKPITGAAVAMLVEDGKLSLDQPVSDFLPAFAKVQVAIDPAKGLESRPAARPMLIRHLLTHTSGLTYVISGRGPVQLAYAANGLTAAIGVPTPRARDTLKLPDSTVGAQPTSLQEFASRLATMPLVADPGTVWHYSVALDLMGAVIEQATGMAFDAFLKQRIFDPLDMDSTTFGNANRARLTTNYGAAPQGLIPIDSAVQGDYLGAPPYPMGGSGLLSSARDYFRFGDMLRGDGAIGRHRIMKAETARMIHTDIMPAGVRFTDGGGFGFAGRVVTADSREPNDSLGSYGWGGAAGTQFWMDPVKGSVVVGMIQIMPSEVYPFRKDLRAALLSDAG